MSLHRDFLPFYLFSSLFYIFRGFSRTSYFNPNFSNSTNDLKILRIYSGDFSFTGTIPTMAVCLLSWFIRHLVMSLTIPFEVFVAIQVLNGFGLGVLLPACLQHAFSISSEAVSITL